MALQWLRINGFSMIGDLQRFLLYLREYLQRLSLGQNNWPIACNKRFHHDWPWALNSRHRSWPSLSQELWYCDRKGPWFQHQKVDGRHGPLVQSVIIVRTCKVSFSMALNIHHVETQQIRLCLLHECLQWLSLGQNNWPIFYSTWLCNRLPSLVSPWWRMALRY